MLRLGHHLQPTAIFLDSHHRGVVHLHLATDDLVCKLVANLVCDQSIQWPCAKLWIVAPVREPRPDVICNVERDAPVV